MFQNVVGVLEAAKQGNGGKALGGVDTHGEALELVRALEVKGVTQKGDDAMKSYANNITKAIVAFNGQISGKDFHAAFKMSKFAATGWSEDFSTQILPTLMNEMKASMHASATSTGVALKSMYQAVVSNKMTGPALDAWYKLGMYNQDDLDFKKDGHVKGVKTGKNMKGFEAFKADPYRFVQDILLPTMKSSGLDIANASAVTTKMGELFGNRNAEFIASLLAIQKNLIEKDRDNVKKAMGMDGLKFLQESDPTTRMQTFAASLKELGSAIGDLALPGVMRGMKGIIDWAHGAAATIQNSPYAKKLGGYWDSMVAGIFGQHLGRKGLMGRNSEYFGAGSALGQGWSHLTSSIGKTMRFWEDAGAFSFALKALGAACNWVASAMDMVRGGLEGLKSFLNSDFGKQMTAGIMAAGQGLIDGLKTIAGWLRSAFSFAFPDAKAAATSAAKMASDKTAAAKFGGGTVYALRASMAKLQPSPYGGLGTSFGSKGAFGLGGIENVGSKVMQPIASAVNSATPMFQQAGGNAMAALAGGLQAGSGQATGALTALMGSLASIASAGVTVPVKLDTAGAEAKLSALMSKAGSIGKSGIGIGAGGRFSGTLSDGPASH